MARVISAGFLLCAALWMPAAAAESGDAAPFLSPDEREAALEAALPVKGAPDTDVEWTLRARFKDFEMDTDLLLVLSKSNADEYVLDISWVVGGQVHSQVRRARPKDAADAARIARGLVVRKARASASRAAELAKLGAALEAMRVPMLPRYDSFSPVQVTVVTIRYWTGNFVRLEWAGPGVAYDETPLMRWLWDLRCVAAKEIAAAR